MLLSLIIQVHMKRTCFCLYILTDLVGKKRNSRRGGGQNKEDVSIYQRLWLVRNFVFHFIITKSSVLKLIIFYLTHKTYISVLIAYYCHCLQQ